MDPGELLFEIEVEEVGNEHAGREEGQTQSPIEDGIGRGSRPIDREPVEVDEAHELLGLVEAVDEIGRGRPHRLRILEDVVARALVENHRHEPIGNAEEEEQEGGNDGDDLPIIPEDADDLPNIE